MSAEKIIASVKDYYIQYSEAAVARREAEAEKRAEEERRKREPEGRPRLKRPQSRLGNPKARSRPLTRKASPRWRQTPQAGRIYKGRAGSEENSSGGDEQERQGRCR
jgi:hypothetical protein